MLLRPEADPAVLLAWIENEMDLANVHRAARVREDLFCNIIDLCFTTKIREIFVCTQIISKYVRAE